MLGYLCQPKLNSYVKLILHYAEAHRFIFPYKIFNIIEISFLEIKDENLEEQLF